MPRIRSVSPDICVSETMAALPAHLERTFVRLWTHCDDTGRCLDNPKLIKAAIYPLHDEITAETLDDELVELETAELIHRYTVEGRDFIVVCSWSQYQHPKNPGQSRCPPPPDHTCPSLTPSLPHDGVSPSPKRPLGVGVGEGEGEGGEGIGEGTTTHPSPANAGSATTRTRTKPKNPPRTPLPDPWTLTPDLRAAAHEANPTADVEREHAQFVDHHRANGDRQADWHAAWRKWCRNAHTTEPATNGTRPAPTFFTADPTPVDHAKALAALKAARGGT